ncbi:MAG: PadR family transcriptional regulator [Planctomycetes bacterium]|nr:PadR family transcriptional regulator [Planctomycetota bacterium]
MKRNRGNSDFLNGVPELLILHLLAERPRYGYELVKTLREASGETLDFGEGCIYPILHRLEAEGLLESSPQSVAGRRRFVYRVTTSGRARLDECRSSWSNIVAGISRVLQGGSHGQPAVA